MAKGRDRIVEDRMILAISVKELHPCRVCFFWTWLPHSILPYVGVSFWRCSLNTKFTMCYTQTHSWSLLHPHNQSQNSGISMQVQELQEGLSRAGMKLLLQMPGFCKLSFLWLHFLFEYRMQLPLQDGEAQWRQGSKGMVAGLSCPTLDLRLISKSGNVLGAPQIFSPDVFATWQQGWR